jgi:hypothetical protein
LYTAADYFVKRRAENMIGEGENVNNEVQGGRVPPYPLEQFHWIRYMTPGLVLH